MKKIGFIGAYDKTDLILYISCILVEEGYKVLIIDATTLQKARYTVPCVTPSQCYITTYEDIDIAIGFGSIQDIKNYIGNQELNYDFVIVDVDSKRKFESFDIKYSDKNYFVTGFDNYSLKRGLEIIGKEQEKVLLTKIMFSKHMAMEEEEYLNFISYYYAIMWDRDKIYFPFDIGDASIIVENQRNARISYKELSQPYKDGIVQLLGQIAPEIRGNDIKRILKNI